jgi:long-chain acyl-CoA synthetase
VHVLLGDIYKEALKKNPNKIAIYCDDDQCTYSEFDEGVCLYARALTGLGIKRGDLVATFMHNRIKMLYLYYACFKIGAVVVPLNYRLQTDEAAYALKHSGSKVLIVGQEFYDRVKDLAEEVPSLERLLVMDADPGMEDLSWNRVLKEAPADIPEPVLDVTDPAAILYSSGSTDRPKGITHTHDSFYHNAVNKSVTCGIDENTVQMIGTQACHASAFTTVLETIFKGGAVVLMRGFEPGRFLALMERHRPTIVSALPTQLREILEHPSVSKAAFSHIKCMRCGGDAVPHTLYDLFYEYAGMELTEGGGMTECEGYIINPPYGKHKRFSLGLPIHDTKLRLVDADGNDVPPLETGEVLVQSKAMMKGYWKDPENTAATIVDGWLHTGDLARQDEDGYYFFVGRIKQIIVRGGSNIAPAEVEDAISLHPQVECCGVVGVPDEHYGQIVHAFVVAEGDPSPTAKDLAAFAGERIAAYKVPERWTFVDEVPLKGEGKVDRRRLQELAENNDEYVQCSL